MNRKLVIFGFGRIGLTHAAQILGTLDSEDIACHVCDPSLFARLLAKNLLPNCKTYSTLAKFKKYQKIQDNDIVVVCTPPEFRESFARAIPQKCRHVLIEKPVQIKLQSGWMSGYVMQHCPLNDKIKNYINQLDVKNINVSLNTNINFETNNNDNWRANSDVNVLTEFGGHALTLVLSTLGPTKSLSLENISTNTRNECNFSVVANGKQTIKIFLKGNDPTVRKVTYSVDYENEKTTCRYNIYSFMDVVSKDCIFNVSSSGTNAEFYLRGFEFAEQTCRLLNGQGDRITTAIIEKIEEIVNQIQGQS